MEIWKDIPNTKGCIQISSQGRARSLLSGKPRILKVQADKKGYLRLRVTIEQRKMTFKMHRAVANAFIPNPNNLPQVNHKDGDKRNNNVDNLEWCTNRDNAIYALHLRCGGDPNGVHEMTYTPMRHKTRALSVLDGWGFSGRNPNPPKPIWGRRIDGVGQPQRFESISEAEFTFNSRHITDVLKGKRTHTKGWTFWYESEGVMPSACLNNTET